MWRITLGVLIFLTISCANLVGQNNVAIVPLPALEGIWDGAGLLKKDSSGIMAKLLFQSPADGKVKGELFILYPANIVVNYRFTAIIKSGTITIDKESSNPVGLNNVPGTGMDARLYDISNSSAMSAVSITAVNNGLLKMTSTEEDHAATLYFRPSIIDAAANQSVLAMVNRRHWDDSIRRVPGLQYHMNYKEYINLQYNQRFLEADNDNLYIPEDELLIVRKKNFQPFALHVPGALAPAPNFKILLQHTMSQWIVSGTEQLKGYFLYCGEVYNLGTALLPVKSGSNHIWPTEPRLLNGPADSPYTAIDFRKYTGVWEGSKHYEGKQDIKKDVGAITEDAYVKMTITTVDGYGFKGYSYQYFLPDSSHNHSFSTIEGYFTPNGIVISRAVPVKQQLKKFPGRYFCDLQFFADIEKNGDVYTMKGETPSEGNCQGGTFSMRKKIKPAQLKPIMALQASPLSQKYLQRSTELIKTVEVESDSVQIGFADNAIVDGDSISVFVNDSLVVSHQFLQRKPFIIQVEVGDQPVQVSMFAENLGSIAPNTAMMTVTDNQKKTEVRMSSDLHSNASIYLQKKKKRQGTILR